MNNKERHTRFLRRRAFLFGASATAGSLFFKSFYPGKLLPGLDITGVAKQENTICDDLREIWMQEGFDQMLESLTQSYAQFGLTNEAVNRCSGTLTYYNQVRKMLFGYQPSRGDILRGRMRGQPSSAPSKDVMSNVVLPQFEPLKLLSFGEEYVADIYAKHRQTASRNVETGEGVSAMTRDLFMTMLNEIDAQSSGAAVTVTGLNASTLGPDGFHPTANLKTGVISVRNDTISTSSVTPRIVFHEVGHLLPHYILESRINIDDLQCPERLAHFDPRVVIEVRRQINNIIGDLIKESEEIYDKNPSQVGNMKMSITSSKRNWVNLLTGHTLEEYEERKNEDIFRLIESNQRSDVLSLLAKEIGHDGSIHAQKIILDNLDFDGIKLIELRRMLQRYPQSTVLQDWVMWVLKDLEHFIIDPEMSYCLGKDCRIINKKLLNEDVDESGIEKRMNDPRSKAAFAYAGVRALLTKNFGADPDGEEVVAQKILEIGTAGTTTLRMILGSLGLSEIDPDVLMAEEQSLYKQTTMLIVEALYENSMSHNTLSISETDVVRLRKLAVSVARATSEKSDPSKTSIQQRKDALERDMVLFTERALTALYKPQNFSIDEKEIGCLKRLASNLPENRYSDLKRIVEGLLFDINTHNISQEDMIQRFSQIYLDHSHIIFDWDYGQNKWV